jgi:4-carboxymuconolactone decarboxylase
VSEDPGRQGREVLGRLLPGGAPETFPTDGLAPDFGRYTVEFAFGEVANRGVLSDREREIAIIAALTALGRGPNRLKSHLAIARHIGLSWDEITEVMLQMTVYAGFPAVHDALEVAMEVQNG